MDELTAFKREFRQHTEDFVEIRLDQESIIELDPLQNIGMVSFLLDKKGSTINMLLFLHFGSRTAHDEYFGS